MSAILRGNFRMAVSTVRNNRWRSLLTTLGIIIGIVSVVTIVSIGEGVKRQIAQQIHHFGKDLITIRPGSPEQNKRGLANTDLFFGLNSINGLNENDLRAVRSASGVKLAAPLSLVSGAVRSGDRELRNSLVLATNSSLPAALNQSVKYGDFFTDDEKSQNMAVIGKDVAESLFDDIVPLGQRFNFRGETFIVRGMFDEFKGVPLSPVANFNDAIFIPYSTAERLTGNTVQMYTILAKPHDPKRLNQTMAAIDERLVKARGGQKDYTVMDREKTIAQGGDVLGLLTTLIAAVAAISLVVGGVGIMNIMLLTVTERMHEIGVRKAIGATSRQIMAQFLMEAIVLSAIGGVVGTLAALGINGLIYTYTDLKPVISWEAVAVAGGVSIAIGIIFGTAPAVKAARKDPIQALRHE
jgi:putative ABC transport system permease protein